MELKKIKLKSDKFRKSRGGHSRFLLLSCEKCKAPALIYQKDGPGILKRLYLDRIIDLKPSKSQKNLICKKCKTTMGIEMIYQKEKRKAYRLFVGAIEKRIIKENEIDSII